jgi:hypothetical protein
MSIAVAVGVTAVAVAVVVVARKISNYATICPGVTF